jgi:hypothetical protein
MNIAIASPKRELGTRAEARTKEIERCLRMEPDRILMLDDDQTMPEEGLTRMCAIDADIVVIDTPPHDSDIPNVYYNDDGSIAWCTIACSLIRADVFSKIDKPWFASGYDFVRDGKRIVRLDKSKDNNVGEDIYFVRKCIDAGLTIEIVADIRCKHFKLYE